jgi:hypothetical protein
MTPTKALLQSRANGLINSPSSTSNQRQIAEHGQKPLTTGRTIMALYNLIH